MLSSVFCFNRKKVEKKVSSIRMGWKLEARWKLKFMCQMETKAGQKPEAKVHALKSEESDRKPDLSP